MDSLDAQRRYGQRAADLFEKVWMARQVSRLAGAVGQSPAELPLLADKYPHMVVPTSAAYTERQAVRLSKIVGSVGSLGFDSAFRPLSRADKARWTSVAVGMISDPFALPSIEVIDVESYYYVIDGHHRVSVAKALDNLFIDANVLCWQLDKWWTRATAVNLKRPKVGREQSEDFGGV
jgi:hypothetical protein